MKSDADVAANAMQRKLWAIYRAQEALKDIDGTAARINSKLASEGFLSHVVAQRFATQGASGGTSWKPLKEATIKQRKRQGFSAGPILVRSGKLATAATSGKESGDARGIHLEFRDGPAPRYSKGGKYTGQRINQKARAANLFFAQFIGKSGALSDYASALNRQRPFYGPLTQQEMAPIFARRDQLIAAMVNALASGHGIFGALSRA